MAAARFVPSSKHLPQLPQILNRFFEFRRFDARLAAGAVAFAEQDQVAKVLGLFQAPSSTGA
jgi:hypothetical protein